MNFFKALDKVLIIAEIGVNHNGDIELAKKLIESAKESGANAVKFQTFSASALVSPGTPKVDYQIINSSNDNETHYEMLKRLELSRDSHLQLKLFSEQIGIEFLSTPYDINSAKFLDDIGVKFFKTASADLIDLPLQTFIAKLNKPTLVATGMSTLIEVEEVVKIYRHFNNENIVLLHTVSNYPCSDESLNLKSMRILAKDFSLPIGFSDHSNGWLAAVLSVAIGCKVIEKHFTLDKNFPGPDHKASSTPGEFYEMVRSIRRAEKILGSEAKFCQPEEIQMALVSRKSLTLARTMMAGEILTANDLVLMRPGTGLGAVHIDSIIGKKLRHNLSAGIQIDWIDLV